MKRFISVLCVFIVCLTLLNSISYADFICIDDIPMASIEEIALPNAEQTEWYWRIYNGNYEKRLWSITYGKWLTDWIYVGPAS